MPQKIPRQNIRMVVLFTKRFCEAFNLKNIMFSFYSPLCLLRVKGLAFPDMFISLLFLNLLFCPTLPVDIQQSLSVKCNQ